MPLHEWTRVSEGLFHHFHQDWTANIARSLNRGLLPSGCYALVEQRLGGPEPDVIAVESASASSVGTVILPPPRTKLVSKVLSDAAHYAAKANRVVVRHVLGQVVSVIELGSPGNKSTHHGLRSFVEKTLSLIRGGIHVLVVDVFPPSVRDPQGIHGAIWGELTDEEFSWPSGKDRTLVSYESGVEWVAYVEPLSVGEELVGMPLFLAAGHYVEVPLAATYADTWEACPQPIRDQVSQ